jgi:uncharacterized membrane protein
MVLLLLAGTLALGHALKAPCVPGDWSDGRQYTRLCYTDIGPLLGKERLTGDRLPYLDPCRNGTPGSCDEYPVLTMWTMRVAAWTSGADIARFFYANAILLWLAAFATALCLYVMVGTRALYFVLAPTLAIYATTNWDLIAVAFATTGTLAYVRRRDGWSGVLLGLGASAKLYPALLVVPFLAGRLRDGETDRGARLVGAAVGTWVVLNLPFAIAGTSGWWEFFRYNIDRTADWDSLWFIACHRLTGELGCSVDWPADLGSAFLFLASVAIAWRVKALRDPGFARWKLGFPILVLFLITSKVYSPQFSLWLLPWFALTLPNLGLFAAFQIADLAVFATRFSWFGTLSGLDGGLAGAPLGAFEVGVVVRAAILVLCVIAWVRRSQVPAEADGPPVPAGIEADRGRPEPPLEGRARRG